MIGCCHAEPITAKLSRAKVKVAHESSELHPNFIYSFNLIFLQILPQRYIINLVNYGFKRIDDKNKWVFCLFILKIVLLGSLVCHHITFLHTFLKQQLELKQKPIKYYHTMSNTCALTPYWPLTQAFDVVWCYFMGFHLSSNYYCRKVCKKVM